MFMHLTTARAVLMATLAVALLSCGDRPDPAALFAHAEYLVLEQRWDEAKPVLKQVLLADPGHPGAHYYLGRCYFASKDKFWFAIAEGEIRTALRFFIQGGKHSPIERFSDTYFELICHLDLIKISLRQIMFLMDAGMPEETILPIVELAESDLDAARAIDPSSPDLPGFVEVLQDIRAILTAETPRPSAPPPTAPQGMV